MTAGADVGAHGSEVGLVARPSGAQDHIAASVQRGAHRGGALGFGLAVVTLPAIGQAPAHARAAGLLGIGVERIGRVGYGQRRGGGGQVL